MRQSSPTDTDVIVAYFDVASDAEERTGTRIGSEDSRRDHE
jgi:hypothetical protein